uniref:Uncharacterized protein n=1 Tax=Romanomermis culicivorax TaxID=13658 RepID=A0A915IAR5_ROMCU
MKKLEIRNEIYNYAKSIGYNFPSNTDGVYLRDSSWPNIKSAAVGKKDKPNKTGAEGGSDAKYTEVELKVFDIIRRESTGLIEFNVRESLSTSSSPSSESQDNIIDSNNMISTEQPMEFTGTARVSG